MGCPSLHAGEHTEMPGSGGPREGMEAPPALPTSSSASLPSPDPECILYSEPMMAVKSHLSSVNPSSRFPNMTEGVMGTRELSLVN